MPMAVDMCTAATAQAGMPRHAGPQQAPAHLALLTSAVWGKEPMVVVGKARVTTCLARLASYGSGLSNRPRSSAREGSAAALSFSRPPAAGARLRKLQAGTGKPGCVSHLLPGGRFTTTPYTPSHAVGRCLCRCTANDTTTRSAHGTRQAAGHKPDTHQQRHVSYLLHLLHTPTPTHQICPDTWLAQLLTAS